MIATPPDTLWVVVYGLWLRGASVPDLTRRLRLLGYDVGPAFVAEFVEARDRRRQAVAS